MTTVFKQTAVELANNIAIDILGAMGENETCELEAFGGMVANSLLSNLCRYENDPKLLVGVEEELIKGVKFGMDYYRDNNSIHVDKITHSFRTEVQ